jgi:hypothetical protein
VIPYQGTTLMATAKVSTNISDAAQLRGAAPARSTGNAILGMLPIGSILGKLTYLPAPPQVFDHASRQLFAGLFRGLMLYP